MFDDANIIRAMNHISTRLSPLIRTNRRVLNLKPKYPSENLNTYDDIGNIDYTGMESKHEEYLNDVNLDHLAFLKQNRFPNFPPVGNRRQEGDCLNNF